MDEYTGPVEEITALVEALATAMPQTRYTNLGQMPLPAGAEVCGNSPAEVIKKRRTAEAGPGTPQLLAPRRSLKLN